MTTGSNHPPLTTGSNTTTSLAPPSPPAPTPSPLPSKSLLQTQPIISCSKSSSFPLLPTKPKPKFKFLKPISALYAADPTKNNVITKKPTKSLTSSATKTTTRAKCTVDSLKSKKALQLPVYSDQREIDSVFKTIDSFPPIMFTGEAGKLKERLAEAAMGNAFLLQEGDCAETFKEFNVIEISDTFHVLL
ncbi:DAHP synthetase [Macleaya cordata]|uniref:Phospho-2-dehydro-3-deoxyheptonate aldolase n=1 Tax=Macleaya cordata TaxID=56857 RepID=A0A200QXA9_MACCD|nr:DAHP synthetase [Macleaya cordata]